MSVNFNEHVALMRKKRKHIYEFQKFRKFAQQQKELLQNVCSLCIPRAV